MQPKKVTLPSKEALLDAMELAKNSTEGADYLETQFNSILNGAKVGAEANDLRVEIKSFAQLVHYQHESSNTWGGQEADQSLYRKMQSTIAKEAAKVLEQYKQQGESEIEEILYYHAIHEEDGRFLRNIETQPITAVESTPSNNEPSRNYNAQT